MKAGFQIAEYSLSYAITIQNIFFKKLIGVTASNIVVTLYYDILFCLTTKDKCKNGIVF